MAIGDGRYPDPLIGKSRATTKIVFGTIPGRISPPDPRADHTSQLGVVFANDLALQAIRESSAFRVGSIIVREKLAKAGDTEPELLSVMIKREQGFNADGGDWQFLLINGKRTKVKLDQKKGECLDCHQTQAKTDYVYPLK